MHKIIELTVLKRKYLLLASNFYCFVASYCFYSYYHDTASSIYGSISGLLVSFVLAMLVSTQFHYKTDTAISILQVLVFLVLPFINIFQITLFQLRFSLEAILFYFLFIKLAHSYRET